MNKNLILFADESADIQRASAIAEKLNIEMKNTPDGHNLFLHLSEDGLSLEDGTLSMMGDFTSMLPRLKQGRLQSEMLVKAAKLKNLDHTPTAIDATAGMGEDSLLLAAAGFQVKLFELDPVIAALLADSIERARLIPELSDIVNRMTLMDGDSINAMNSLSESVDLIYLDPMFPARNKSGLIKKKFQLLQQLEQPCSNEHDLLSAAISAKPKKIVIKRPAKGPFLDGVKPDFSYPGKAIRYDCLININ